MAVVSIPNLGQPATVVDQLEPDDLKLWSVTTIIGALDKPALVYWAADETAKAAIDFERTWKAILEEQGRDEALKFLGGARYRRPKGMRSATELGTVVHAVCEEYALTGQRPEVDDEVLPFLDQFDAWLNEFQPSYQATEVCVYHPTYGYAGTADAFLTIDGVRFIVDYKTSRETHTKGGKLRKPYPDQVGLQLAAYAHAEMAAVWRPRRMEEKFRARYYLLGPGEQEMAVPVPEVDAGLAIQITPGFCHAYPITVTEPVFEAFLHTQEAARWVQQTSTHVMGERLEVAS